MQSNPASMDQATNSNLSVKKKVYDDKEEAAARCYKHDGNYVHPSASIRRALITAVTGKRFGKVAARNVISSSVFPSEDFMVICNGDGKPATHYEIDKRSVVIQKSRIMRCRPKFMIWSIMLPLDLDLDGITLHQVTEGLNMAGRNIGLGELRPDPSDGKKGVGTYGRFTAEFVK